eukprot:m.231063 g.231063  ORF g.231063 m.231063 type:complete len:116 (-) comp16004_c0_seq21:2328-2675(-)
MFTSSNMSSNEIMVHLFQVDSSSPECSKYQCDVPVHAVIDDLKVQLMKKYKDLAPHPKSQILFSFEGQMLPGRASVSNFANSSAVNNCAYPPSILILKLRNHFSCSIEIFQNRPM